MAASVLPSPMELTTVDPDLDVEDWDALEPKFEQLADYPVETESELRRFLEVWNELDAVISEGAHRLRLEKAQNTSDEDVRRRWMTFLQEVNPELTRWGDRLSRKLVDSPVVDTLEGTAYEPFLRQTRNDVELFEEENVPLQSEVAELTSKYGEISGDWTVDFDGEERTMSQMQAYLQAPDRAVRKRAWYTVADRRLEDGEDLEDLFDEMFDRRHQIAKNAEFDNFRDYTFAEKMRDYDPEACFRIHELVEEEVLPLAEDIVEWKKSKLELDRYRPWDGGADPEGRDPLEPFETSDELKDGVERMMHRLDERLGRQFGALRDYMDLESRPGKEQGGFMTQFSLSRRPFIFANVSGHHSDVTTLLHESGHAFHTLASLPEQAMVSTTIPMEFCEVSSMAMELLHYETLDEFYDEQQRRRAIEEHLRRIPSLLLSIARGDAFQHWLYTHPDHTAEERQEAWMRQQDRFQPFVDRQGLDEAYRRKGWHAILHFFQVPFYYIEYAFAQLGALQVALNYEEEPDQALDQYHQALSLGAQRDTEGLYEAAGAEFVPTRERVSKLMEWIRQKLEG